VLPSPQGVVYDSDPKKRNLQMQRTANALKSNRLRTYVEKITKASTRTPAKAHFVCLSVCLSVSLSVCVPLAALPINDLPTPHPKPTQHRSPTKKQESEEFFASWGNEGEADICEALSDLIILTATRCLHGDDVRQARFVDDGVAARSSFLGG